MHALPLAPFIGGYLAVSVKATNPISTKVTHNYVNSFIYSLDMPLIIVIATVNYNLITRSINLSLKDRVAAVDVPRLPAHLRLSASIYHLLFSSLQYKVCCTRRCHH